MSLFNVTKVDGGVRRVTSDSPYVSSIVAANIGGFSFNSWVKPSYLGLREGFQRFGSYGIDTLYHHAEIHLNYSRKPSVPDQNFTIDVFNADFTNRDEIIELFVAANANLSLSDFIERYRYRAT